MTKYTLKLFTFLFLVLALSIISVSASVFVTPANSASISGTALLNASLNTSVADLPAVINCTFFARSSLTANSSWTKIKTISNYSALQTWINTTFASTIFEDSNNYQFNASCYNFTNSFVSVVGTATVTIDNTIPTAPTLSPLDQNRDTKGNVGFNATVVARETTSCVLYFDGINPGNPSYTMTHSGDTCNFTLSNIPQQNYKWYVTAGDETNTTSSSTNTLIIETLRGGGDIGLDESQTFATSQEQAQAEAEADAKTQNTLYWVIGGIVAIVIFFIIIKRR